MTTGFQWRLDEKRGSRQLGWTIAALAMLACSVMAALALHIGFERPVTAWLRRRLDQNATALPERPVTL